jgi:holo-[acyl-carrier protein] synthase
MLSSGAGSGKVVVAVGVDLIELGRVRASLHRFGDRLIAKLMGPEEAAGLPRESEVRALALAHAIAAKEAASKAIGTGWSRGVRWRDVVLHPGPPPSVTLHDRALDFARRLGSPGVCRLRLETRGDLVLGEVRLIG